jgi:hypothetical protein
VSAAKPTIEGMPSTASAGCTVDAGCVVNGIRTARPTISAVCTVDAGCVVNGIRTAGPTIHMCHSRARLSISSDHTLSSPYRF